MLQCFKTHSSISIFFSLWILYRFAYRWLKWLWMCIPVKWLEIFWYFWQVHLLFLLSFIKITICAEIWTWFPFFLFNRPDRDWACLRLDVRKSRKHRLSLWCARPNSGGSSYFTTLWINAHWWRPTTTWFIFICWLIYWLINWYKFFSRLRSTEADLSAPTSRNKKVCRSHKHSSDIFNHRWHQVSETDGSTGLL